jgi:hypothetical protein
MHILTFPARPPPAIGGDAMADSDYDAARVLRWLRATPQPSASKLAFELCNAASFDRSGAIASALLGAGADPNCVSLGKHALVWAMLGANAAVVRALCAAGADVHARCADEGEQGLVMTVFTPLSRDPPPWPEREYVEALRALSDAGRDVTRCVARQKPFSTLAAAAMFGAERVLKFLLDAGADVNDRTGNSYGASALHFAVEMPLTMRGGDASVAAQQSLRCVRHLLRAGADTRLPRFDGNLAVDAVMLVGDLRVADAIFEAEERRGVSVASLSEAQRELQRAVATYRRTGDASLPEALRKTRGLQVDWPPKGSKPGDWQLLDASQMTPEMLASARVLPTRAVPHAAFAAMQAGVEAHVPRSADEGQRCAAPGCGTLGAALKMCPCRSAYYCRCAAVLVHSSCVL